MSDTIPTLTTDVGRAEAASEKARGLQLTLTHVAIGDGQVEPGEATTTLTNERDRAEILSASKLDDDTVVVETVIYPEEEYICREIGVFSENGTLFAIGYLATGIRSVWPGASMPIRYQFQLTNFDIESINFNVTMSLDLAFIEPLVVMATELGRQGQMQRELQLQVQRLRGLPLNGMEILL